MLWAIILFHVWLHKRRCAAAVLLWLTQLPVGQSEEAGRGVPRRTGCLRLEVETPKPDFMVGEPVQLTAKVTNLTDQKLKMPAELLGPGIPRWEVSGPDGEDVSCLAADHWPRSYRQWREWGSERPLEVDPGESVEYRITLSELWPFRSIGTWRCRWELALWAYCREFSCTHEDAGEVSIKLRAGSESELREICQELSQAASRHYPGGRKEWREAIVALMVIADPVARPYQLEFAKAHVNDSTVLRHVLHGLPRGSESDLMRFLGSIADSIHWLYRVELELYVWNSQSGEAAKLNYPGYCRKSCKEDHQCYMGTQRVQCYYRHYCENPPEAPGASLRCQASSTKRKDPWVYTPGPVAVACNAADDLVSMEAEHFATTAGHDCPEQHEPEP